MRAWDGKRLVFVVGCWMWWAAASRGDERLEFFEKRIRPVLAAHCLVCHCAEKAESELRLDHISFLERQGNYGAVLVPGKPLASGLYVSLTHANPDLMMPFERDKLDARIIADFKQWIAEGAAWPDEPPPAKQAAEQFDLAARITRLPWIWQAPATQAISITRNRDWPRADIDHFILARLEAQGIEPAADAEPEVWLRRVCFAITGLPPSVQQIQEFLRDPSREHREAVVDQLLGSPHFGERWARHWMDLVRYAESRGHESDFDIANAWHYRDYLIRAFNDDVSYDQFVVEHIAGDLLETPRINAELGFNESILATAWPFFGEEVHSPVDIRQDECERIDNKIDVFSKTFLGLTVACARCHDHKFDAITQKDYYALAGFMLSSHFRQVRFDTMQHNGEIAKQLEALYQETQAKLAAEIAAAYRPGLSQAVKYLPAAKRKLDGKSIAADQSELNATKLAAWVEQLEAAQQDPAHPLHVLYRPAGADAKITKAEETSAAADGASQVVVDYSDPKHQGLTAGYACGISAQRMGDVAIPSDISEPIGDVLLQGVARRDSIWNSFKLEAANEKDSGSLNAVGRSSGLLYTPTFVLDNGHDHGGKVHILMQGESQIYAAVDSHLMIIGPLHQRLVATLNAPKRQWITLDLSEYRGHRLHLEFGAVGDAPLSLWKVVAGSPPVELSSEPGSLVLREDFEQAVADAEERLAGALDTFAVRALASRQDAASRAAIIRWLLTHPRLFAVAAEPLEKQRAIVADYRARRVEFAKQIHTTSRTAIALLDGSGVDENVLIRGKYQKPGEVASRRLPAAFSFAQSITGTGSGRRQLARQLVDPQNPLVARVMVNRLWHHLLGRGIVASVDNFGWLGQRPTHPELLDHLAHQFVFEDQWSIKRMIKRIVLSRTFAMSSRPNDPRAEELDPKNLLRHRMSVRRLEAEAIRDNILAVSGRLDRQLYGTPVPVHLTEFVVGRGRPAASGPLDGGGRRSIYTAVRRNFLPTMMLTFDMPIPFSTVGRRNVTNVPAQALGLMNDKLIYEQAVVWAKRIQTDLAVASAEQRIAHMYWEALGRQVTPAETVATLATIELLADFHGVSPDDAKVWTDLCHTLFRLNEFIYLR